MEQIQNNRVITDLYRENAQFPGIALDGSDVYLCWQRFVDRHDSLMASSRRGDDSKILAQTKLKGKTSFNSFRVISMPVESVDVRVLR